MHHIFSSSWDGEITVFLIFVSDHRSSIFCIISWTGPETVSALCWGMLDLTNLNGHICFAFVYPFTLSGSHQNTKRKGLHIKLGLENWFSAPVTQTYFCWHAFFLSLKSSYQWGRTKLLKYSTKHPILLYLGLRHPTIPSLYSSTAPENQRHGGLRHFTKPFWSA